MRPLLEALAERKLLEKRIAEIDKEVATNSEIVLKQLAKEGKVIDLGNGNYKWNDDYREGENN
jgi:hypothetical protein